MSEQRCATNCSGKCFWVPSKHRRPALKIKKDLEFDSKIRFLLCRRYVFSSENASNQVSNTDYFGDTQVERLLKGQPPLGGF